MRAHARLPACRFLTRAVTRRVATSRSLDTPTGRIGLWGSESGSYRDIVIRLERLERADDFQMVQFFTLREVQGIGDGPRLPKGSASHVSPRSKTPSAGVGRPVAGGKQRKTVFWAGENAVRLGLGQGVDLEGREDRRFRRHLLVWLTEK